MGLNVVLLILLLFLRDRASYVQFDERIAKKSAGQEGQTRPFARFSLSLSLASPSSDTTPHRTPHFARNLILNVRALALTFERTNSTSWSINERGWSTTCIEYFKTRGASSFFIATYIPLKWPLRIFIDYNVD